VEANGDSDHETEACDEADGKQRAWRQLLWGRRAPWRRIFTDGIVPRPTSNYGISGTVTADSLAAVLSRMDMRSGDVFVDLGCGDGAVLCAVRVVAPCVKVRGVDGDAELVQAALRNLQKFKVRQRRLTCAALEQLSDVGRGVTHVFCFAEALRGGDDTAARVLELCRASPTLRVAAFALSGQQPSHPMVAFGRKAEEDGNAVSLSVAQQGSGRKYTAWIVEMESYRQGEDGDDDDEEVVDVVVETIGTGDDDTQQTHDAVWAKYLELDALSRPIIAKRGNLSHGWTFEKRVKAKGSGWDRYVWDVSYETFSRGRPYCTADTLWRLKEVLAQK
jgi:precorrin-6B methylase 2